MLKNNMRAVKQFTHFLVARFIRDKCPSRAAVLAYTSLISLVPLMTIVFAILSQFPFIRVRVKEIEESIFSFLVPTAGDTIRTYLDTFVQNASYLTAFGAVVLVFTATTLMAEIDGALNHIWRVKKQRKLWIRVTVYLVVLIFGPLLVGLSFISSHYVITFLWDVMNAEAPSRITGLPYMLSIIAFTLIFWVVPNTEVSVPRAFVGALVAAVIFELMKWGFTLYITNFANYHVIYGTFATIPIFLFWLYLSWVVFLLGAEFTYALGAFKNTNIQNHKATTNEP